MVDGLKLKQQKSKTWFLKTPQNTWRIYTGQLQVIYLNQKKIKVCITDEQVDNKIFKIFNEDPGTKLQK